VEDSGGGSLLHMIHRSSAWLWREQHVDVFKERLTRDAANAVGSFDEVVARPARLFAAERVDKSQRLRELTSAHEKTRAIYVPSTFRIHDAYTIRRGVDSPAQFFYCNMLVVCCRCLVERLYAQNRNTSITHELCNRWNSGGGIAEADAG